jgi:Flp pilus assembly protein TadG
VTATRFLRRLRLDVAGTAMLEFAIVGPAMILMLFGVLQVGIGLQNYNALRNVSADVARYAMVQYSTGNKLSNDQMIDYAKSVAEGSPYLLKSDIQVSITDVALSQVTNAREKTLTIQYQIPSVLDSMGLEGPEITYTRPMFLAV